MRNLIQNIEDIEVLEDMLLRIKVGMDDREATNKHEEKAIGILNSMRHTIEMEIAYRNFHAWKQMIFEEYKRICSKVVKCGNKKAVIELANDLDTKIVYQLEDNGVEYFKIAKYGHLENLNIRKKNNKICGTPTFDTYFECYSEDEEGETLYFYGETMAEVFCGVNEYLMEFMELYHA